MPRLITVSDVRKAIYFAAGHTAGPGESSTPLLGRLFHETFGLLTGPDQKVNLVRPLEKSDRDLQSWEMALTEHAYLWCVGPQLLKHQSELQTSSKEVLSYWKAVERLCKWLCDVLIRQSEPAQAIEELRRYIFADNEVEYEIELSDMNWLDTVVLQGRIDAILRQPATGRLCAVEIKLGHTHPEADLAQACLYHMLLVRNDRTVEQNDLALWTFQPEEKEQVWKAQQLREAQAQLKKLIGTLAGVDKPAKTVSSTPSDSKLSQITRRLISGFEEFGAPIQLERSPLIGPSFYRFLAKPAKNVKADKILNMGKTIWPRLKTDQPPQISMERGLITIDVQRLDRETMNWDTNILPKPYDPSKGISQFPVGVSVQGCWTYADLSETEHSHFLVAGTNGSGKSEWLKMVVGSLCAANSPKTLSLVLIDPKRTAFSLLQNSPFLRRPIVIPAEEDALLVLDDLIEEMEKRNKIFQKARVSDLKKYNESGSSRLPRIICICDEYADLILSDSRRGKEVERRVGRLGAMGRAAGVHLILATQRPSKDIVKGVIRANLNARVALKVNERIDSHIILEQPGAEALLGKGDLLFKDLGKAIRLQAPLISEKDLKRSTGC
jgi:S-DNA-T family DNA segregation ATPase FtsK/SpoIIIE